MVYAGGAFSLVVLLQAYTGGMAFDVSALEALNTAKVLRRDRFDAIRLEARA